MTPSCSSEICIPLQHRRSAKSSLIRPLGSPLLFSVLLLFTSTFLPLTLVSSQLPAYLMAFNRDDAGAAPEYLPMSTIGPLIAEGWGVANSELSAKGDRLPFDTFLWGTTDKSLEETYDAAYDGRPYTATLGPVLLNSELESYLQGANRTGLLVAPILQGDVMQQYDSRVMSFMPDLKLQVIGLIEVAKWRTAAKDVTVLYVDGFFTDELLQLFPQAFRGAEHARMVSVAQEDMHNPSNVDVISAYNSSVAGPQVLFFLGPMCTKLTSIYTATIKDAVESDDTNVYTFATFDQTYIFLNALNSTYGKTMTQPIRTLIGQTFFSSALPFLANGTSALVQRVNNALKKYNPNAYMEPNYKNLFRLYGYTIYMVVNDMQRRFNTASPDVFAASALRDTRYTVKEVTFGDFSRRNCSIPMVVPGVGCQCNLGGRSVYFGNGGTDPNESYIDAFSLPLVDPVTLPRHTCDTTGLLPRYPLFVAVGDISPGGTFGPAIVATHNALRDGIARWQATNPRDLFRRNSIQPANFPSGRSLPMIGLDALRALNTTRSFSVVSGVVNPDIVYDLTDYLVLDPIYFPPTLSIAAPHVVHPFTTLQEEMYAMIAYISMQSPRPPLKILWGGPARGYNDVSLNLSWPAIQDTIRAYAKFFGVTLKDADFVDVAPNDVFDPAAVTKVLDTAPENAVLFMLNVLGDPDKGPKFQRVVEDRTLHQSFIVPFDEITLAYNAVNDPLVDTRLDRSKILFFTNIKQMPSSTSRSGGNTRNRGMTSRTTASATTPGEFTTLMEWRSYLATEFLSVLAQAARSADPTGPELLTALYTQGFIRTSTGLHGLYHRTCPIGVRDGACVKNFGARGINLWSLADFQDPSKQPQRTFSAVSLITHAPMRNEPLPEWRDDGHTDPWADSAEDGGANGQSTSTSQPVTSREPSDSSGTGTVAPTDSESGDGPTAVPSPPRGSQVGPTVGIAVGVVVGVLLLALLAFLLVYFCCLRGDSRDDRNAPIDPDKPVTLIFTDIESSTALWATVPAVMSKAVQTHHRVMRELIVKHRCYEVKTIGDSFMIACASADAAIALCHEAQLRLQATNWGSGAEIDAAYRQFALAKLRKEARKAQRRGGGGTGEDTVAEEALGGDWALPEEAYARVWCGLRVRIGMHTGLCDIARDPVTQRFDYYGTTVNMAARTESLGAGGQVLCTCATHDALSAESLAQYRFTPRGAHVLRGVSEPVEMLELATVDGRRFDTPIAGTALQEQDDLADKTGGLRSEETPLPLCAGLDKSTGSDAGAAGGVQADEPMGEEEDVRRSSVETASEVLEVYFAPYSDKEKAKLLQQTCKQLGIEVPARKRFRTRAAWADAMIRLLAERTTAVIEYKHSMEDDGGEEHNGNTSDGGGSPVFSPLAGSGSQSNPLEADLYALAHPRVVLNSESASPLNRSMVGRRRSLAPVQERRAVAVPQLSPTTLRASPLANHPVNPAPLSSVPPPASLVGQSTSQSTAIGTTRVLMLDTGEVVELRQGGNVGRG